MVAKLKRLDRQQIEKRLRSIGDGTLPSQELGALWLFGSYARKSQTPLSDLDLAYLPAGDLTQEDLERFDRDLYRCLSRFFQTDEITLVNLKEAPLPLAFAILKEGQILLAQDSQAIAALRERVLQLYPEIPRLRQGGDMPLDRQKLMEQLRLLQADLKKLKEKSKLPKKAYLSDEDSQIVVERKFQTAIESCVNIGNHLISVLELRLAEDYASVFLNLAEGKVLSKGLAEQMADMARFRNLLVHLYWRIDHEKIHREMKGRIKVLERFAKEMRRFLKSL